MSSGSSAGAGASGNASGTPGCSCCSTAAPSSNKNGFRTYWSERDNEGGDLGGTWLRSLLGSDGPAAGGCSTTRGGWLSWPGVGADEESEFHRSVWEMEWVGLTCCTSSPSSGAGAASESPMKKEDDGVEAVLDRWGRCVPSEAGCEGEWLAPLALIWGSASILKNCRKADQSEDVGVGADAAEAFPSLSEERLIYFRQLPESDPEFAPESPAGAIILPSSGSQREKTTAIKRPPAQPSLLNRK